MASRRLAIAASLVVLLVPAVAADNGLLVDAAAHTCSGAIDLLCTHVDCNTRFCVILTCVVYLGHDGHLADLVGCTPP